MITSNEGKPTGYCVHRMVAITYLPNDSGLPSVNHKNGDKLDNRCDNLEWCSHAYNMQHSYDNSLRSGKKGVSNPSAKLDYNKAAEIRELRYSKGTRYIDLAEMYGVSRFTISSIISGKRWNINDL